MKNNCIAAIAGVLLLLFISCEKQSTPSLAGPAGKWGKLYLNNVNEPVYYTFQFRPGGEAMAFDKEQRLAGTGNWNLVVDSFSAVINIDSFNMNMQLNGRPVGRWQQLQGSWQLGAGYETGEFTLRKEPRITR